MAGAMPATTGKTRACRHANRSAPCPPMPMPNRPMAGGGLGCPLPHAPLHWSFAVPDVRALPIMMLILPPSKGPAMDVLISAEDIRRRIGELARQINQDYDHQPVTLIGILSGSLMF